MFPLGAKPFPLPRNYTVRQLRGPPVNHTPLTNADVCVCVCGAQSRVLGAEAACWGHCLADVHQFRRRTAGFLPVVAERLWSPRRKTARASDARARLGAMLGAMRASLGVPEAPSLAELTAMDA